MQEVKNKTLQNHKKLLVFSLSSISKKLIIFMLQHLETANFHIKWSLNLQLR